MASPCLHAASGDLYYLQGLELRCVNAHTGKQRTLNTLAHGHMTGFSHVSDDNSKVCVPTIHESAFKDVRNIDATVQELGLSSYLRVFDTQTGEEMQASEVKNAWITHVQFQPNNPSVILFNHEWAAFDCGIRRIWLSDRQAIKRVRSEGANADGAVRSGEDWICHEVWTKDGRFIVYHGRYETGDKKGLNFVGRVSAGGDDFIELSFPEHFRRYGHFTLDSVNRLVSDGYGEFDDAVDNASGGRWISLIEVDWDNAETVWTPLCKHGSSWTSQDAHPHPIFNHAGTEVLFTSDVSGKRCIYSVEL